MGKRYKIIKPKHGYFRGGVYDADIAPTIDTGIGNWHTLIGEIMEKEIKCEQVGILSGGKWNKCHAANRRVYSDKGLSPTITTMGGGQREPKIIEKVELVKYGSYYTWKNKQGDINTQCNRASDVDGYSLTIPACDNTPKIIEPTAYDEQNGYIRQDGCVGTLTTDGSSPKHNNRVVEPNYRIRKLTERECGRLMGVKGEDCEKIAKNQSTSSQYHLYGDSIVTTCLMAIFGELFEIDYETKINNLIGELKQ